MPDSQNRSPDVAEYELLKVADASSDLRPRRPPAIFLVLIALIAAAAVAAYIVFMNRRAEAPATTASADHVTTREQTIRPLGAEPAPIVVPPLDQTDPLVRELVRQITSHPRAAAWLASDGLVRNFAVVVANIDEGIAPAVHLRVLRPATGFEVMRRDDGLAIDPRSYRRYDALAAAAASIDPPGAARVYATLKPRLEEAYGELGSGKPLDRALEHAIVMLLKTPAVGDPLMVRPEGGTGYAFVNTALESLTAPQKQLLRTGATNVRTIQASLRSIALALGIPPDRLPPPPADGATHR
jgi:hypothetical protein